LVGFCTGAVIFVICFAAALQTFLGFWLAWV